MKIISVVGARPNFMKIGPLMEEMKKHRQIESILVHTEQHYDENMSKLFFDQLELPKPDVCLGVGSGSHAQQTAKIMLEFEKVLIQEEPDLVIVVGDVNSTIACALTASKLHIKVAHVEAGLRSFDKGMPEEINRILTDCLSDYLFVTEKSGEINLLREGVDKNKIFFVGNVMIDTLLKHKERAEDSRILFNLGLEKEDGSDGGKRKILPFALATLHRPNNVDVLDNFPGILEALEEIQKHLKIIYPMHPRTRANIEKFGLCKRFSFLDAAESASRDSGIVILNPLGYLDFVKLMSEAKLVLTDSGGIQEETTVLGVPCLTLRENTERPVTVTQGSNSIVGTKKNNVVKAALEIITTACKKVTIPDKWDGFAAKRIIDILLGIDKESCQT